jgi:alpha-glucosidase (family GH31 glycosyl hydrolase)
MRPSRARGGALLALAIVACSSGDAASPSSAPLPPPRPEAGGCVRADLDDLPPPKPHTARWAFEPWISKDISDRTDTYAFVDGFKSRGIPVGAVVLDSPWETSYNTFVPRKERYPDLPGMIADMHAREVRVVAWITSLVNETSIDFEPGGDRYDGPAPNLDEGLRCKYFIDDGETYVWWKGKGASVDFFNPHARAWWHRQQDAVLRAGLDGWKLDFGESYVREPTVRTAEGDKPHQAYSERYYEDFLAYGRKARGDDFVTMVRAWDESYDLAGRFFARREHAPVAWMGDNRRDWVGLADALDEMFVSARAGYPVVGSDIGGYLDHDDKDLLGPVIPFDTLVFARWIAVGALSPFMQLHGRANLTPWTVPDHAEETVAIYKYWATLHHALVPYLYSLSEEAWAGGPPVLRPVGEPSSWRGDYRWTLGDALFVAPILDATGKRKVSLPDGARWIDWWTGEPVAGGTTVDADFAADRARVPLYVREGSIVPLEIEDDVLGLGAVASRGARTVLVHPSGEGASFRLHEDDAIVTIAAKRNAGVVTVDLSAAPKRTLLRIRAEQAPSSVTVDGAPAPLAYDAPTKTVVVEIAPRATSAAVVVR